MSTHDPRKVLETLRNHLTQPETNVAFLLGAGTSCSVRINVPAMDAAAAVAIDTAPVTRPLIPNVAELTAITEKEIRKLDPDGHAKRFGMAFDAIEAEVRPVGRPTNIEDILSCVRRKVHAVGEGDMLAGLNKGDLHQLEKTIRGTIAAQVNPARSSFPERLPHEEFVRWIARMPRTQSLERGCCVNPGQRHN